MAKDINRRIAAEISWARTHNRTAPRVQGKGWTRILSGRGGVDVAFVDRGGANWVRRAMGRLEELPERPLEHFGHHGLFGPYEFQTPERTE